MKILKSLFFISLLLAGSCSVESEKINYGNEACHFCKMTIVDNQHAAEIVTAKGKVFKYDAIECMLNDLKQKKDIKIALYFVNDYSDPGVLQNAETATFLISKGIKSPMGAFLSAFKSDTEAQKAMQANGGKLYNWKEIQNVIE